MSNVFYAMQPDYIFQLNALWDRATTSVFGSSSDSLSVTTGSKSFTTNANLQFAIGSQITLTATADLSKYMSGQVTAYNQSTGAITVNVTSTVGSGTFSSWSVTLSGAAGATGVADNISIGTVTSGTAAASITGTSPNKFLNLTLQEGAAGAPNVISIGTVNTGTAAASITGTSPSQVLNLTLPTAPPNTLSIGTVTSGTAAATITGTSPNQVLNLTLQQGAAGAKGVNPRGTWSAPTPYSIDDLAYNAGSTWRRIVAGTTGTAPSSDATNWEIFAQKGTDGAGSVASVTAGAPLASSGGANPDISIQVANTSQGGYLTSSDWNTFNNKESTARKDDNNGYVGLTLFKINFKNVANTQTSYFTNVNTASRLYTFQNRDGTIVDDTDLALKANLVSPSFTTPALGVASATSVNKVTITAPATSSTLTIANGKTFTSSNTLTFTGIDGSTLNVGTGGTLGSAAYTASSAYAPATGSASITTVGTVTSGTWNGTVLIGQYGGTGVANTGKTLTLGGNHVNSGAFASTFTFTGITNVTFPTAGTLITLAGTETLTNKTLTSPVINNPTGITKTNVGLSNVDNTSDASKPVSTATQTALNAKQDTLVSGTNIKTVGGVSLLGSGDISSGGGSFVRINGGSLSSSSSAEFTSVFSSTYSRYLITVDLLDNGSSAELTFEFYDGSSWITNNYNGQKQTQATASDLYNSSSSGTSNISLSISSESNVVSIALDITGIASGEEKRVVWKGITVNSAASGGSSASGFAYHPSTSAMTGFRVKRTSGSMTGDIQIYGLTKA
jgi:hypothetical protein